MVGKEGAELGDAYCLTEINAAVRSGVVIEVGCPLRRLCSFLDASV